MDACKKEAKKLDEANYPPMNFEKYESPGLFPKLRKGKSFQPKSDEEFAKMIEAKTKRIMKKKLAAADSPIPGTPKQNLRVCILFSDQKKICDWEKKAANQLFSSKHFIVENRHIFLSF